jgi:glutathione reductase (NADPH)
VRVTEADTGVRRRPDRIRREAKGLSVDVHVNDMQEWFSVRTYAETGSKVLVDKATDRILGAHFVGHAGQELVNIFGLAMRFGITASQIRDSIYAYPTFASDIRHMLGGP